jgi:hypothetical protein
MDEQRQRDEILRDYYQEFSSISGKVSNRQDTIENEVEEKKQEWLQTENEKRQEEGLPEINRVPAPLVATWYQQSTQKYKTDLTEQISGKILEDLGIKRILEGAAKVEKQIFESLGFKKGAKQQEIEAKRAQTKERLQTMIEEEKDIRRQYEDEKQAYDEEKQAYDEAVDRIKQDNEEHARRKRENTKQLNALKKVGQGLGLTITESGRVKIENMKATRAKVLQNILRDAKVNSPEQLSEELQESYEEFRRANKKEIIKYYTNKFQDILEEQGYFEPIPEKQAVPRPMRKFPNLAEFRKSLRRRSSEEIIEVKSPGGEESIFFTPPPPLEEPRRVRPELGQVFITPISVKQEKRTPGKQKKEKRPAVVRNPIGQIGIPGEQKQESEEKQEEEDIPLHRQPGRKGGAIKTTKTPKTPKTTTNKKVKIVKIKK